MSEQITNNNKLLVFLATPYLAWPTAWFLVYGGYELPFIGNSTIYVIYCIFWFSLVKTNDLFVKHMVTLD